MSAPLDRAAQLAVSQENTDTHGGGCREDDERNGRVSQSMTAHRDRGGAYGTDQNWQHQRPPPSNANASPDRKSENQGNRHARIIGVTSQLCNRRFVWQLQLRRHRALFMNA